MRSFLEFFKQMRHPAVYNVRHILDVMKRYANTPLKQLRVIGSASNALWLQMKADVLNYLLEVPVVTETTSMGTVLLVRESAVACIAMCFRR